jgi:small-conductance mechanosensitive channel
MPAWLDTLLSGTHGKIASTVGILLILGALNGIVARAVAKNVDDLKHRYLWRQVVRYILTAIAAATVIRIWIEGITTILTALSLIAAAVAVVLKELLQNIAGWAVIVGRKMYSIGDRIRIGSVSGDVTEVGLMYTTIAETTDRGLGEVHTGALVRLPNSLVFTQPVANSSEGSTAAVWNELRFNVAASSNREALQSLAMDALRRGALPLSADQVKELRQSKVEIMFTSVEPTVAFRPVDGKVEVTLRYICKPHRRRDSEQVVWNALLDALAERSDISLA